MLDLLDLIQLQDLGNPFFAGDKITLGAYSLNVLAEDVEIDWDIVNSWEDVG